MQLNKERRAAVLAKHAKKYGTKSRGLGDTVAKATSAIGIKPCKGCEKRKALLNKLIPYGKEADRANP